jgi:hypothetical protein
MYGTLLAEKLTKHDCRNEGLRVERAHCHGIFDLSGYHQERTSPTYSQRKNNLRQLHPGQKYRDNVLAPRVVPHFDNHALADRPMFMDDNARPHRARNPRQLHPHPQKQLYPKCGCPEMKCFVGAKPLHDRR